MYRYLKKLIQNFFKWLHLSYFETSFFASKKVFAVTNNWYLNIKQYKLKDKKNNLKLKFIVLSDSVLVPADSSFGSKKGSKNKSNN